MNMQSMSKTSQIDPYCFPGDLLHRLQLNRALLASFLKPFSMHFGSSKRCFLDCRSIFA